MTKTIKSCSTWASGIAALTLMIAAISSGKAYAGDILTIKNCSTNTINVCTYNGSDPFSRMAAYDTKAIAINSHEGFNCQSNTNPPKCTVVAMDPSDACGFGTQTYDVSAGTYIWYNHAFLSTGSVNDACPSK